METIFRQSGNCYFPDDKSSLVVLNSLPSAIYKVVDSPKGFYLEKINENYSVPDKMYGDINKNSKRILDSWNFNPSLGVLMSGTQGSGKSLLAKKVSNDCIENGIPVIVINEPYTNDVFKTFISSIGTCVVWWDEFEKTYNEREDQEKLLTLLDGTYSNNILWLLTCNNPNRLTQYVFNRSGRIRYHFKYNGLSSEVLLDYCSDYLKDHTLFKKIEYISKYYGSSFNFDMLQAIVSEVNNFPEDTIPEILSIFNFNSNNPEAYSIKEVLLNGTEVKVVTMGSTFNDVLNESYGLEVYVPSDRTEFDSSEDDIDDDDEIYISLHPANIIEYIPSESVVYKTYIEDKSTKKELFVFMEKKKIPENKYSLSNLIG